MVFGADLIAGFLTETDAHHAETLALVAEGGISFLHVFPFSARPGTPAARMPQLPVALRRERAAQLRNTGAAAAQRLYAARLGREESVLMERGNLGHTEQFCPVRVAGGIIPPGSLARLRITGHAPDGLLAEAA